MNSQMITTIILLFIESTLDIFCLKTAFDQMLQRRKTVSSILYFSVFFAVEAFFEINTIFFAGNYTVFKAIITVLLNLLLCFGLTYLYHSPLRHRIFITISLQLIFMISEFCTVQILPPSTFRSNPEEYTVITDLLVALISKLFSFIQIMLLSFFWKRKKNQYPLQYHLSTFVTPIISVSLLVSLSEYLLHYATTIQYSICIYGLMLLNLLNYYLLDKLLLNQKLLIQSEMLKQQIQFQKDNFQELSAAYRNTRRVIHDTTQHVLTWRTAIEQKKYSSLTSMMSQFLGTLKNSYITINTGNLVIDALVSNYKNMAEQESILFKYSIEVNKERIHIPDYELCVILGNLLSNSFQACSKMSKEDDRAIEVFIKTQDFHFVLETINSYDKNPDLVTSFSLDHGFGLENVRTYTENRGGVFKHAPLDDHIYQCIVILPVSIA